MKIVKQNSENCESVFWVLKIVKVPPIEKTKMLKAVIRWKKQQKTQKKPYNSYAFQKT